MKTVIEMAIKAGAIPIHKDYKHRALVGNESLERFAELVRADEREQLAKMFDSRAVYADGSPSSGWYEPDEPAKIIRAIGEQS